MTEILTESFCERCGTRYTFETAAPRRSRLGRVRTVSRGLRNFVMQDDIPLSEAMADARSEEERAATAHQLDAFHKTFNFCLTCRQYTCGNCWNTIEGRCLTCSPLPEPELPFAPPVEAAARPSIIVESMPEEAPAGAEGRSRTGLSADRLERALGIETPEAVAAESAETPAQDGSHHVRGVAPGQSIEDALADYEAQIAAEEDAEAEAEAFAGIDDLDGALYAGWDGDRRATRAETEAEMFAEPVAEAASVPEPEPILELEPVAEPVPEPELAELAAATAPEAVAEPEPILELEPVAEPVPEPEPEPILELEPVAELVAEPEPILELEPEPILELEPEPIEELVPEPELVAEPVAESVAEQAVVEPVAEPEPQAAAPREDVVTQPTWPLEPVEPTPAPAAPGPEPGPVPVANPWLTVAPDDGGPEPQWPVAAQWGRHSRDVPTTLAGRQLLPRDDAASLWAASAREVLTGAANVPTPMGVAAPLTPQPCVSCGLSLSANARFCRRCGTRQG